MSKPGRCQIMVMSDHGFAAFDYAFNLNTWLGAKSAKIQNPRRMPWDSTHCTSSAGRMGQNGDDHSRPDRRLLAEKPAIESVTPVPRTRNPYAPDLIVGYAPGYRASWETALGEAPPEVIVNNDDAWIGDHCIAAEAVPGILVTNRKPSCRTRD